MNRAIALAGRGIGRVSPNPLVGAVIVKDEQVVGEGYHLYQKKDHAEIVALDRAGNRAAGADLYVNLEPCSHQGRTPPCVTRLVEAGIHQVFVAVQDPNPLVTGHGISRLRGRGIRVEEGICSHQAVRLNEVFFHFIRTSKPFVSLKLALTLDGKIAAPKGDSHWITGRLARREVHRLRYQYDAILVGVNTVLKDDPSLDVRWTRRNQITKVILDSHLRTPADAKVFKSKDQVIIFHANRVGKKQIGALKQKASLVPVTRHGRALAWEPILRELGNRRASSLLIEGGSNVASSALRAGVVHKVYFFYAPTIVGEKGISGIGDLRVRNLQEALALSDVRIRRCGQDFRVEAYVEGTKVKPSKSF